MPHLWLTILWKTLPFYVASHGSRVSIVDIPMTCHGMSINGTLSPNRCLWTKAFTRYTELCL